MSDHLKVTGIDLEKEILRPYTYLMEFRGKKARSKLIHSFNHWLKVPRKQLQVILKATLMLHVGTLLLDDIQDNTRVRRGVPAAHCVYGLPLTMNAGTQVFLLACEKLLKLSPKVGTIIANLGFDVVRGQSSETYWRENGLCPTEEQYKLMTEQRTGTLFAFPVQVMQFFSHDQSNYSDLARMLSWYFQVRDDYCNLVKQEALEECLTEDKIPIYSPDSVYEDITEGKFSFPFIHAMQCPDGVQIMNILRKRTDDVNLKKQCMSLLEKTGSLQYTRAVLTELDQRARAEITRFGGNPELEAVLDELLDWQS